MNAYKLEWMAHASMLRPDGLRPVHHNDSSNLNVKTESKRIFTRNMKQKLAVAAGTILASHLAQSQFSGSAGIVLRTSGRLLIRAIPIVSIAYAAYSIYELAN